MWDQDYKFVMIDAILHLAYALLLTIDTFEKFDDDFQFKKILLGITGLAFLKEVFQIYHLKLEYLGDIYNYFDFFGELIYTFYAIHFLMSNGDRNRYIESLHIVGIFLIWLRTISQLRIFQPTRYLIRMIIKVFSGMGPFLVILIGSTISFTVIFQKINDIRKDQSME